MTRPYTEKNYAELSAGLAAGKDVNEIMLTPVPAKRKSQKRDEWKIQSEVDRWWLASCAGFNLDPCLYYSVPNGFLAQGKEEWQRKGSLIKAYMLKLAGLKPGIPDNVLAVMRKGFGALYIEYKTPEGIVKPDQIHVQSMLRNQGYSVQVCRSTEEAIAAITNYLT